MSQEQTNFKWISGVGVVAAFGLFTLSSNYPLKNIETMSVYPEYRYEASRFNCFENTVCNSSLFSSKAFGDIIVSENNNDFMQTHKKIHVNIKVQKIKKHVSSFDFEEEYEEI